MQIGEDYEKIEFSMLGFDLIEPNAFIGDFIILVTSFILVYKLKKIGLSEPFFTNWTYFFLFFGAGMFLGGLGHVMFNYWGFYGKYLPWYLGITSVFFIEQAMISIYENKKMKSWFLKFSEVKLIVALLAETAVFAFVDMSNDHSIGLRVPTITTAIGLIFALGILGYKYKMEINPAFKYMFYSVFVLLPSALFITFKINIHQWFDKNDFSHVMLIVGLILYFKSIKGYALTKNT